MTAVEKAISDAAQMQLGIPPAGQVPTMTPNGQFGLRKRQRKLMGIERLALQGIAHFDNILPAPKLCHLAGEALCAISTIPALVVSEGYF